MSAITKTVLWALAFLLAFGLANTYGTRNAHGVERAEGIPVPSVQTLNAHAARADMAREVVAQDWADLRSKQRRKPCAS
jgi:hypothetical protein